MFSQKTKNTNKYTQTSASPEASAPNSKENLFLLNSNFQLIKGTKQYILSRDEQPTSFLEGNQNRVDDCFFLAERGQYQSMLMNTAVNTWTGYVEYLVDREARYRPYIVLSTDKVSLMLSWNEYSINRYQRSDDSIDIALVVKHPSLGLLDMTNQDGPWQAEAALLVKEFKVHFDKVKAEANQETQDEKDLTIMLAADLFK